MNAYDNAGGRDDAAQSIRATNDERRLVADELAAALGRGQLELGEFEQRTESVWAGRSRADIVEPLKDLVPNPLDVIGGASPGALPGGYPGAELQRRSQGIPDAVHGAGPAERNIPGRDLAAVAKAHVTGEKGGSAVSMAMMFGAARTGDWVCPSRHVSCTLMGGVDIDLRNARFESRETEIVAVAIMGGICITVPEDVRVSVGGFGLMGGFGQSTDKDVVIAGQDLPPDAPHVRVSGFALMGGVEVTRKPRYGLE